MSDANENPERKEEQQKLDEFEENHPEAISENGLGEEKEESQSSGDQNEQERSESMQQEEVEEQKLNSIEEKDQINDTTSEETVEQKKEDTKEEETKKQTATEESKTTTQSTGYSGWGWSSFYSSFKKATQELAEKAQELAETGKESAKQYLTQLKEKSEEVIKDIQSEESKAGNSMKNLENQVSLPWEGIEFESVKEELKKEILDLSLQESTFTIGITDSEFSFDMNSNIPLILKLRKIDPHIGEARLKLVQSHLMKDETFWKNYFSHIFKLQKKYREVLKEQKKTPVHSSPVMTPSPTAVKSLEESSQTNKEALPNPSSASPPLEMDDIDIETQLEEYLHQESAEDLLNMNDDEDMDEDIDLLEQNLRNELGLN